MTQNHWLKGFALIALGAAIVVGCEEDESDTKNNGFQVQTIAGGTVSVEGTWLDVCQNNGTDGFQDATIFVDDVVTGYTRTFTGDTTCSGTYDSEQMIFNVTAEAQGTGTATWEGGVAPDATYPDVVDVTHADFEVVDDPSMVGSDILVADDVADPMLMYSGKSDSSPLGTYETELGVDASTKVVE